MLTRTYAVLLPLAVLSAAGCRPNYFEESCYLRSSREVDWDFVHDDVGFSANDVMASFPEAIYYKVNPGPGLALPFGQRGADWSLRIRSIEGAVPTLRRFHVRPCAFTPFVPYGEYQYHLPVHLDWERLDGEWSFALQGVISTSEPWTDDFFDRRPTMSVETEGWWPAEVPPDAIEAATQELIDEGAGPEHFPVESLAVNQLAGVHRIGTDFATSDGYSFERLRWSFELHATVPPEFWP